MNDSTIDKVIREIFDRIDERFDKIEGDIKEIHEILKDHQQNMLKLADRLVSDKESQLNLIRHAVEGPC